MTTGLPAQFLAPFAVVITVATLSSLLVSFTLTPLLAKLLLARGDRPGQARTAGRFGASGTAASTRVEHRYERLLRVALPKRWLVIAIGLVSFAAGIALLAVRLHRLRLLPERRPERDRPDPDVPAGDVAAMPPARWPRRWSTTCAQRIPRSARSTPPLAPRARGGPNTDAAAAPTRRRSPACWCRPRERNRAATELAEDIRRALEGRYPGVKVRLGVPNAFGFGGFGGAPIQVQVQGSDPAVVDSTARSIQQAIQNTPGAVDVDNSNDDVQTQLRVKVDWTRAADLGVIRARRRCARCARRSTATPPPPTSSARAARRRFRSAC